MDEVRVGIVGMGIGRANGRGFRAADRGRVVALCDLEEDRMEEFAEELDDDVLQFTDYAEMCRCDEVDAVFVGTPNQLHVPVALEAVRNGKHVLVTKPLSDALDAARELVEAAEAADVVGMMSLSLRFSGGVQHLGRLAKEGDLGELYYGRARSIRRSGIPDWSAGFVEEGGGAFRDMGVHVLDSAWWIMGRPRPVSVAGVAGAKFGPRGQGYWDYRHPPEEFYSRFAADDYGGGLIRFENGAGLQAESFWASHMDQPHGLQIELFGTEAGARLSPLTVYRTRHGAPEDVSVSVPDGPGPWQAIAEHFIACILDGAECQAPLRDGMLVQQMLEALLESGETGREVRLD
jgi:predicted dehydrogenase